jgi:translation initiation factor 2 beta subunit (eIF-2beta)/eIF-5
VIIYSPIDGDAINYSIEFRPKHCFLITQLGKTKPKLVSDIEQSIKDYCQSFKYEVIDASAERTGRDFLLKIWKIIESVPVCIVIIHEDTPVKTQANLYYELGVAQALGKETVIIKTPGVEIPSDLNRSEYIEFNDDFKGEFKEFLKATQVQADHYEELLKLLEQDPILAIDYLKRAFLITGNKDYKSHAKKILKTINTDSRAKNSIEHFSAAFSKQS